MDRRKLLTAWLTASSRFARQPVIAESLAGAPTSLALPTADQLAWQDLEVGMFVHFAPNTWQDVESDNLSTPLTAINPKRLDTDQWAQCALALGAKYIVFVAKHQGGFCMWQTQSTDYGIRNTPWRNGHGDVLAEVARSCNRYGLKFGVYISPRDDHFGATTGGLCKTPQLQKQYDAIYRQQLTEVLSRYGELVEVWFDGSTGTPVGDLLLKYQPHAVVFQGPSATIRWVGNEDGFAPYPCWNGIDGVDAKTGTATSLNSDPDGDIWMPNEVDVSIRRPNWFWSTTNEKKVLTLDQLLSIYYCSVGRGAQLLLNIPANREGLLSDPDFDVAKTFGNEIQKRFAMPLAKTSGHGPKIALKLGVPTHIDTLIVQEDISRGECVRRYRIEGHISGAWKTLGEGSSIGHKRIQPIEPVLVDSLRLVTTESAGIPILRSLAVFYTAVSPPSEWSAQPKIWAANIVGDWQDNVFSIDLTPKIKAAARQYRLRFVPRAGSVTALGEISCSHCTALHSRVS